MPKHVTCDWENLAFGLEELLSDIEPSMETALAEEIPQVGKKGAKEVRKVASERWNGVTGTRYSSGFSSKAKKSGKETSAEIGNRNVPGLVHLLEKGHNTLAGQRVAGNPHMAPVFDEFVVPELEKAVSRAVDRALEG